ncbi:hypothetical protein chiPu_0031799 [Chiloscyllium punctatum]|uniref:Secreted protein n=1 Tax=Chiloscyllium punctatum TaxID=137246 RepID=A0A401TXQ0_CHIPU|nr:hypothetical protein [Chiloscyllium punctatum]
MRRRPGRCRCWLLLWRSPLSPSLGVCLRQRRSPRTIRPEAEASAVTGNAVKLTDRSTNQPSSDLIPRIGQLEGRALPRRGSAHFNAPSRD